MGRATRPMARSPRSPSPLRTPTPTSAPADRPARTTVTRALVRRPGAVAPRTASPPRLADALYREAFAALPEAVVVRDAQGRLLAANDTARALLRGGLTNALNEHAAGDPAWEPVDEEGNCLRVDQLPTMRALRTGQPQHDVVIGVLDGTAERRWLLVNANPMKPCKDREAAVVASFVDVTPRANAIIAEKERTALLDRQRAELERSNAELEQFAYVTSHDLSEPLRVINGFTQLLAEELGDNLDPVVREYCGFITDATGRMGALIADLLTYSRVGRAVTEAVPVELDAVLADVGDLLGPTVADEGGELKIGPAL